MSSGFSKNFDSNWSSRAGLLKWTFNQSLNFLRETSSRAMTLIKSSLLVSSSSSVQKREMDFFRIERIWLKILKNACSTIDTKLWLNYTRRKFLWKRIFKKSPSLSSNQVDMVEIWWFIKSKWEWKFSLCNLWTNLTDWILLFSSNRIVSDRAITHELPS